MRHLSPGKLMLIGFFLLVLGVVLPFLMVLRIIEPTLFLGFLSYLVSFGGIVLGLIGALNFGLANRRDKD
jgi:hypothetical protein